MIPSRIIVFSLACSGLLFPSAFSAPVQDENDPSGIIEAMAIEEIAEEGVKAAVVAGVLSGVEAEQLGAAAERIYDSPEDRSDRPEDIDREFIALLGESLKAEVEQGRMTESDGWSIYLASVADVRSWYAEQEAEGREVTVPWSRRPSESGGLSTLQLMSANLDGDHRLKLLARPEYLRRDARHLAAELRLDSTIAEILDLMISDYVTSYESEVDRFLESVQRGQRREAVQTLDRSLAQIAAVDIDTLDWEAIQRGNPWMQKRAGARLWVEDSLGTFQRVIGGIREDLASQRTELLEGGDFLSVSQCLDALQQLRRTRTALRGALEEQMRALVPQGAEARFDSLLEELELERILNASNLSGMRLNLESAFREAAEIRSFEPLSQDQTGLIANSTPVVMESARPWMEALLDAEVAGYSMTLKSDASSGRIGDSDLAAYGRALREATERELILRDTMQSIFMQTRDSIAEHDPVLADRFQMVGWYQGFPTQMRTRWCERAAKAVLAFEDLDPALLESVGELHDGNLSQLPLLRQQAIQSCLEIESRVARERIQLLFSGLDDSPIELMSVVREPEYRRFTELDDRTEALFKAVLTEEQLTRVPRRPGTRLPEWDKKESGKGKGNGKGKGDGKGRGGGSKGGGAKGGGAKG